MATYTYDPSWWDSFDKGNSIEWVMTSGNGAYAGGSLIGAQTRTHQGYLVASLNPPTERMVILEKISEYIRIGGEDYDLEASSHRGGKRSEGQRYLRKVTYDGTIGFCYELGPAKDDTHSSPVCESGAGLFTMSKHIALVRGENTVAVDYVFTNYSADEAEIYLTPLINCREHNTLMRREDLDFDLLLTGDTLSAVPAKRPDIRIDLSFSEGEFIELSDKYDEDIELPIEVDLETEGLNCAFMPYDILIKTAPGEKKRVSVVCTLIRDGNLRGEELLAAASDRFVVSGTAAKLTGAVRDYYDEVIERAHRLFGEKFEDTAFFDRLVLDADHFIADRRSTGLKTVLAGLPWFTDWGRDTMIAFCGLTLCTGRFDDAREILLSFAQYERNGLIPNMFPDNGADPLYNTADASLWYFIAVYDYLLFSEKYGKSHNDDAAGLIRTGIYPVLVHILEAYEHGTDNSIYMEPSGLIHAGSGLDQVTWMDVRVGDMVVTPRHGCPVEINALWYNALMIGALLAERFGDDIHRSHWTGLAKRVKKVYQTVYLADGYLYDVVDGYTVDDSEQGFHYVKCDDSIRPNQIYAVSLPFSPLDEEVKRIVTDRVGRELYVGLGLRSLSPTHPDYHGQYRGALMKRDLSYHQGTAWGYLLGAYIDAYRIVHRSDADLQSKLDDMFKKVYDHQFGANCIGGICEIFEGDAPHKGRGCYTQAWSTGEILRAYLYMNL